MSAPGPSESRLTSARRIGGAYSAPLTAAVLAVVAALVGWHGVDLPAALYRAGAFLVLAAGSWLVAYWPRRRVGLILLVAVPSLVVVGWACCSRGRASCRSHPATSCSSQAWSPSSWIGLAGLVIPLASMQWRPAFVTFPTDRRDPSSTAAYLTPLLDHLDAHRGPLGRVEVVPTRLHWEVDYTAPHVKSSPQSKADHPTVSDSKRTQSAGPRAGRRRP